MRTHGTEASPPAICTASVFLWAPHRLILLRAAGTRQTSSRVFDGWKMLNEYRVQKKVTSFLNVKE